MLQGKKLSNESKKKIIAKHFGKIMETLGLDLEDESLSGTPGRVAKMYVDEIFYGLDEMKFPKMMTVNNGETETVKYNQMLLEKNIPIYSACEHHFVPIVGKAHIAYIPNKKVIGLSKLNRIADFYARRPQVQERLTEQIYSKLVEVLGTEDVAVIIDASHMCVSMRGVGQQGCSTVTSKLGGVFERNVDTRKELFDCIKM